MEFNTIRLRKKAIGENKQTKTLSRDEAKQLTELDSEVTRILGLSLFISQILILRIQWKKQTPCVEPQGISAERWKLKINGNA